LIVISGLLRQTKYKFGLTKTFHQNGQVIKIRQFSSYSIHTRV